MGLACVLLLRVNSILQMLGEHEHLLSLGMLLEVPSRLLLLLIAVKSLDSKAPLLSVLESVYLSPTRT